MEMARRLLRQHALLEVLPRTCVDRLVDRMASLELARGAILARAHRPMEWIFLVVDGQVAPSGEGAALDGPDPSTGSVGLMLGVEAWLQEEELQPAEDVDMVVVSDAALVFRARFQDLTFAVRQEPWVREALQELARDEAKARALEVEMARNSSFVLESEARFLHLFDALENCSSRDVYNLVKDGIPKVDMPPEFHPSSTRTRTTRQGDDGGGPKLALGAPPAAGEPLLK